MTHREIKRRDAVRWLIALPQRLATLLQPQGGPRLIVNGMMALCLALIMWRLTGSFLGWLALFVPGSALVFAGMLVVVSRD
jgi:hypothetical protein